MGFIIDKDFKEFTNFSMVWCACISRREVKRLIHRDIGTLLSKIKKGKVFKFCFYWIFEGIEN